MTALPTNMSYGKIRGRFGSPILSSGDADGLPDFQSLTGLEVTFTPKPDTIINLGASPAPITFLTEKTVGTLDDDGYLIGPDGREGVNLIATDDDDIAPTGWTYSVSFGGTQATYRRLQGFEISVPAGSTRWLTSIAPVPSSTGTSTLDAVQAAIIQVGVAVGRAQGYANDAATSAAASANKVNKGSLVIDATDHGVTGTGDRTTALQAFFSARSDGEEVLLPAGTLRVDGPITIARNNLVVRLRPSTVIDKSAGSSTTDGILVTGNNVVIQGGQITSPTQINDANVQPTYAVIHVKGSGCHVDRVKLVNLPKVGIYGNEVDDFRVTNCDINGGYPKGMYVGTVHFGINLNPTGSGDSSRVIFSGNIIRACVQGISLGNYGPTATGAYGAVITGNIFDGCNNHGVYNAGFINGTSVTGNTFTRCQIPIALTGNGHVVSGNLLYTHGTGTNEDITGISMREPIGCSVTGNTILGDTVGVVIDLGNYTAGQTEISRNVVSGNTVDVTGVVAGPIIRIGRSTQTLVCNDNLIANNTVRGIGSPSTGLVILAPMPTRTSCVGNRIVNNNLIVTGESNGIWISYADHCVVQGNSIRFEYDAPSAKTLSCVYIFKGNRCTVSGNDFHGPAGFGTNVALKGISEINTGTGNRFVGNGYHGDLTKLASFTPLVLVSFSDAFIDEAAPGAPISLFGSPGSRWARTDGAAGTSLYAKESASTSTVWVNVGTLPSGSQSAAGISLGGDLSTGFYRTGTGAWEYTSAGTAVLRLIGSGLLMEEGMNITTGATTGTRIGVGSTQKLGFWGATPVVRPAAPPADATDLASTIALVNDLKAKLRTVGIVT